MVGLSLMFARDSWVDSDAVLPKLRKLLGSKRSSRSDYCYFIMIVQIIIIILQLAAGHKIFLTESKLTHHYLAKI